ncbi:MAG TPA: helix-turn-helix transcriptional regulator [Coleofasciculaceae cyanobacterium]
MKRSSNTPASVSQRYDGGKFVLEIEDIAFSQWLVLFRCALGLTQGDVAEKLGVSSQSIGQWERGDRISNITPDRLIAICNTFRCEADHVPKKGANFINC